MNTIVLMKMVPDTVEELDIDDTEKRLDDTYLRLIPAEQDEHALEQALLMKEKHGGSVTVLTLDLPECDDALFSALAKGVDKAIKITHGYEDIETGLLSKIYSSLISGLGFDLVLTGTQAIDDVDGELGALLASSLNLPYVGVAVNIQHDTSNNSVEIVKELGGGLMASFESPLPLVVGIQAAENPPRYVPMMKVRKVMKTMKIETMDAPEVEVEGRIEVVKLFKPPETEAEMLTGSPEEIVKQLVKIFKDRGIA